jgi:hypothetical protein
VTSGIFKGIPEFKTYPPYRFSSQNLPETNHVFSSFKSERNLNGIMKLPIKMWSLSSNIFKYWIPGKKKVGSPKYGGSSSNQRIPSGYLLSVFPERRSIEVFAE